MLAESAVTPPEDVPCSRTCSRLCWVMFLSGSLKVMRSTPLS